MFFDKTLSFKALVLKPYEPRPISPLNLMTENEIRSNIGQTLAVDLESYRNYFLIAFSHVVTQKQIIFEISPDTTFDQYQMSWVLNAYRTVGFNTIKFDLPLIWLAYKTRDIDILFRATQALINDTRPYDLCKEYDFRMYETNHIDLIEVAPLKGSLKTYGARLHAKRLQDLPFDPRLNLTREEAMIVRDYCLNSDLPATILMFDNLQEQIKLREELSAEYDINLMSKSDAQMAEAMMASEIGKITGTRPKKPILDLTDVIKYRVPAWLEFKTPLLQHVLETVRDAEIRLSDNGNPIVPDAIDKLEIKIGGSSYKMGIGGLHSMEKSCHHLADEKTLIIDRDVRAYYPRIIINNNFVPKQFGPEFLEVFIHNVESRDEDKLAGRHARADGKKIKNNGTYGKYGSIHSIMCSPSELIQVVFTGQLGLFMEIEMIELAGIPVVSANTDGIVIKCPVDRYSELVGIIERWEAITGFTTEETRYKAVYSRDVNGYLAIKLDGSVKGKGPYGNPWAGGSKEAIFRFHRNPETTICIEAAIAHMTKGDDIERTIRTCTDITKFISVRQVKGGAAWKGSYLGKVVRWYYAINEFDSIRYALNGNKVASTDGAKPLMDLPDDLPTDIDYQWYVNKTIDILTELTFINAPSKRLTFFD